MPESTCPSGEWLNNRQRSLRTLVREFTMEYIMPVAAQHDAEASYPFEVIAAAREAGLLNTVIPRSHGGPGFSCLDEVVAAEEIGYGCVGIWTTLAIPSLAETPIVLGGSAEQHHRLFGEILDGAIPAFALTEPTGGSDVAALRTTAKRRGDYYVISGHKSFISTATVASIFVLFAKTDREAGHRGISVFVVPSDTPGLKVVRSFDKSGHRAYDTSEIVLEDVAVPAANLIGAEGDGFRLAMKAFDRNRPAVAAAATGLAARALDEATRYAVYRSAFGSAIVEFQAVAHKLADIAIGVDAARLLCMQAAKQLDSLGRNVDSAAKAKAFATDLAMRSAVEAVQIFGAAGIMRHNPVEKLMRDAKVLQVYEGTNEIQRNIIVRELVRSLSRVPNVDRLGGSIEAPS